MKEETSTNIWENEQIVAEIWTLGGAISEEQLAWRALLSLPPFWKASVN
jgi:hypothetical protein